MQVDPITGKITVNEKSLEVNLKSETDIRETVIEDNAEISFGRLGTFTFYIRLYKPSPSPDISNHVNIFLMISSLCKTKCELCSDFESPPGPGSIPIPSVIM